MSTITLTHLADGTVRMESTSTIPPRQMKSMKTSGQLSIDVPQHGTGRGIVDGALNTSSDIQTGQVSRGRGRDGLESGMIPLGSGTPKTVDDIDPDLLTDLEKWMKSLRLHKYLAGFEGMTWESMVVLDDAALEARGVITAGARRKLLRTFVLVRKKMGMDGEEGVATLTSPSVWKSLD